MSTDKIVIPIIVLTKRRKDLFLQSALDGFRPQKLALRRETAENSVASAKRHTLSADSTLTLDKQTKLPVLKSKM